jgi:alpha-amylase
MYHLADVDGTCRYQPLIDAFKSTSGSISALVDAVTILKAGACKDTSLLGTFSENHDIPRFASLNGDIALAKNVLAFTMLTDGIPIIYQGQEQHYNGLGGGSTPFNREALWLSGYNEDAELYKLVKTLNAIRKNAISDDSTYLTYQNNAIWSDTNNIAMRKGNMLTVVTNSGSEAGNTTLSVPSGYDDGVQVTELLSCTTLTSTDGTLSVPMSAGIPKIYYPTVGIAASGLCGSSSKKLKLRSSRLFRHEQ